MNIGIAMFPTGQFVDVALLAKWAEELGFESLWAPEHTVIPVNPTARSQDYPDGTVPEAPREYSYIADPFVSSPWHPVLYKAVPNACYTASDSNI